MLEPIVALILQIAINTTIFYLFYRWVSNTARKREKMRLLYIVRGMATEMQAEADKITVKGEHSALRYANLIGYVKAYESLIPQLEKEVYGKSKSTTKGA